MSDLSNTVSKAFEDACKEIVKKIEKQMPQRMATIKNEVSFEYMSLVKNVFESVFDNYYGNNYDKDSLMDSLFFVPSTKNLWPDLTYNKNKLKFLKPIEKEKKAFNKNAVRESTIKQFGDTDLVFDMATTLFNEAEFEEDFAGFDSLSQWDEVQELTFDFWNMTRANNNRNNLSLSPIEETYKIAYTRSQREFEKRFNTVVKPKVLKKYGIKLN